MTMKPKGNRGFSLVEIALAIGIVAFAMIGLLAMMPAGLKAADEAAAQTAQAHIITTISSDLSMLPFGEIDGYVSQTRYYDLQGRPVPEGEAVFVVTLAKRAPSYPDSEELDEIEDRMVRVSVSYRRKGEPANRAKRVTISVVNNGVS